MHVGLKAQFQVIQLWLQCLVQCISTRLYHSTVHTLKLADVFWCGREWANVEYSCRAHGKNVRFVHQHMMIMTIHLQTLKGFELTYTWKINSCIDILYYMSATKFVFINLPDREVVLTLSLDYYSIYLFFSFKAVRHQLHWSSLPLKVLYI